MPGGATGDNPSAAHGHTKELSVARGDVVRYELHDGVIHSAERMTYTAVNEILTDRNPDTIARYQPLVPIFELMGELFTVLNQRRRRRGSIDFDLPENELILDEAGKVSAILASERNVAHRLIEEFMLLANETVAQHLAELGARALHGGRAPPIVAVSGSAMEFRGSELAAHPHARDLDLEARLPVRAARTKPTTSLPDCAT